MNTNVEVFLGKLGLTEYEAKTLATLFTLPDAESPDVARAAQVPKTRVYDVLDTLVEKGLAVQLHSRPKKYRALKPTDAFQKIIADKVTELERFSSEAQKIGQEMEARVEHPADIQGMGDEKVLKVNSRTDFYKILAQEIDSAKTDIQGLTKLDAHHHLLHDALTHASQRNVHVQLAGTHPPAFKEYAQKWGKNVQLKDAAHGLHAYVIDGKKVVLLLSDLAQEKPEYHFAIWPNNPAMAGTLQNTFNAHWEN